MSESQKHVRVVLRGHSLTWLTMNHESWNIGCAVQIGQAKCGGKNLTYCFFLEISRLGQTWDSVTKNLSDEIRQKLSGVEGVLGSYVNHGNTTKCWSEHMSKRSTSRWNRAAR